MDASFVLVRIITVQNISFVQDYCRPADRFNPFRDGQLIVDGHCAKTSLHFDSLSIFCLGCKTISGRAARRLIVLHPK